MDALSMAWLRRKPAPGLVHHSERGGQYASHAYQARLKAYGMACSISRKGNCRDNAPTESFFNSLKSERVHGTRYGTRAETEADLFDYIVPFYNRKRRHSTLGYASPVAFLATGSVLGMRRNWRHNADGLEDEMPREAQTICT